MAWSVARLWKWVQRLLKRPAAIVDVVFYPSHGDVPAELGLGAMAIVGNERLPKWAIFSCPCRRGHLIQLNLQRRQTPNWTLILEAAGPTLRPSVDYRGGFRCHFYLRRGRVTWVS
jgi:hypothetical protein